MRIVIDCSHLLIPGGVSAAIRGLVPALLQEAEGSECLLCFRGLARPAAVPGLPEGARCRTIWVRLPRRWLCRLENMVGLPPVEWWSGPVDAVHGTHFVLPASRCARRVLTVHDVIYLRRPDLYADGRLNAYGYRYLLGHSLRRARRVLASSECTRRDLVELCGVKEEKVWVVPLGRDPGFGPLPEALRRPVLERHGITRRYALFPVGTFEPRKNIRNALAGFARAFPRPEERPLLVVTGVGAMPAHLRAQAETLKLDADIRVCRAAYPEELVALMSGASWGMYLSLYEGFGIPPLEAMACGLPMVVSQAAAIMEVVGDAALAVPPEDVDAIAAAMGRLEGDDVLRSQLASRGLARAASPQFSWRCIARQTLAAYRDDHAAYLAACTGAQAAGQSSTSRG